MTEARQPDTAWKVLAVFCGASEGTGCGAVQEFGDLPRSEAEVGDGCHMWAPVVFASQQVWVSTLQREGRHLDVLRRRFTCCGTPPCRS